MSLRWIQENCVAPTCDAESSDIEDSGSDDSYDSELSINNDTNDNAERPRDKRHTTRHPTTSVTFDKNGSTVYNTKNINEQPSQCILWDPRQSMQNPAYKCSLIKLYCRTGYYLTISPGGCVRGEINVDDQTALFSVQSVSFGIIRIQSHESGLFLAINNKGHLYGELKENNENTEWEQWNIGSYEAFRSHKYVTRHWWLGIKKNGRPKPGLKTAWGQKAIQFIIVGHS